jgi:hypothetical protein
MKKHRMVGIWAQGAALGGALLCVCAAAALAAPTVAKPTNRPSTTSTFGEPVYSQQVERAIYGDEENVQAPFSYTGAVQAVQYTQNVITVTAAGGEREQIFLTPTTAIQFTHGSGSMANLKPGTKVIVTGTVREGQHIATTIVVK